MGMFNHSCLSKFRLSRTRFCPLETKRPGPQFMASLTIKAIEKSFSSYFADANIKNRTKHDAMQNVANRLNLRSHKGKKVQFHITEGDGAKWDSCCNADVRDQIEFCLSTSSSILPRILIFGQHFLSAFWPMPRTRNSI